MKKKLILITLMLAIILVGCVKVPGDQNNPPDQEETVEESKQGQGLLKDRYIENDRKYLEVEIGDQVLKINASTYEDFALLEPGSLLDLTYEPSSLKLISVNVLEDPSNLDTEEDPEENLPEEKKIYVQETIDLTGLNQYHSFPLNYIGDYGIDLVNVYTDAEKVGSEFLFDDGNVFVVIGHGPQGDYELFNKRIQLGDIKVNVYTEDDQKLIISILESQTAGISFKTFEKTTEDYFVEIDHYQGTGNINMIGSM
ncbi:MAG: hypothetical protein Q4E36_04255 [Bacillota bacterium]|nr:hypothetical protein [Bacillota bacterium]